MSNKLSIQVNEAFKYFFDYGMIYKGSYITNHCIDCKTALSNDEIDFKDNQGYLYYINYDIIEYLMI